MAGDLRARVLGAARARLQLEVHLCAGPGCRRFAVAHRFLRKDGVFLDGEWLCSAVCLEAALAGALAREGSGAVYTMPRLPRMPFRLLLLQRGVLSEQALTEALLHTERTGLSLAQALLALELVTEAELAASLAAENGCAFYALPPAPVAPEVELPRLLADRFGAASVHKAPGRVLVGFVSRIDRELLRAFEQMTGEKAEACFITATHRERQLALGCSGSRLLEPAAGPLEAARASVGHALGFGAERLSQSCLGGVVWIRMWAETGPEDRFFQLAEESARPVPRQERGGEKKLRVL